MDKEVLLSGEGHWPLQESKAPSQWGEGYYAWTYFC
jgi:hypothetical protein